MAKNPSNLENFITPSGGSIDEVRVKIERDFNFEIEDPCETEFVANHEIPFEEVEDPLNFEPANPTADLISEHESVQLPVISNLEMENNTNTSLDSSHGLFSGNCIKQELILSNVRTMQETEDDYDRQSRHLDHEDIQHNETKNIIVQSDWRKENKSLSDKLSYLMNAPVGHNQDVVFVVGAAKKRIFAHSFIIWMNSPVFENILGPNQSDKQEGLGSSNIKEIVLDDISPEILNVILKYMYTGEVNMMGQSVEKIYQASKSTFQVFELVEQCVKIMLDNINLQNAVDIFRLAKDNQDEKLLEQAFIFILQNGEQILLSTEFLTLDRETVIEILGSDYLVVSSETSVFQAAKQWAENICFQTDEKPSGDKIREILDQVIYTIRFPLFTAEEFKLVVVPSNILQPKEVIELFSYFVPPFETVRSDFPFLTTPRAPPFVLLNEFETNTSNTDETTESAASSKSDVKILKNSSSVREINQQRRGTGRPKKVKKQKSSNVSVEEVIDINSSSSSSSEESSDGENDDWKESGNDSDSDSSDPPFKPPPRTRKRKPPVPLMFPINTFNKIRKIEPDNRDQSQKIKIYSITDITDPKSLTSFIARLSKSSIKLKILKVQEDLKIYTIPSVRVVLPNIQEFYLNLSSPRLNHSSTITQFKSVAVPMLNSMKNILFFDGLEIQKHRIVNKFALEKLWLAGIKVTITFNGVTALKLNVEEGEMLCAFIRFPALGSIIMGLNLRQDALRRLTLSECEFRLFSSIPTKSLKYLTILKVSGLQGINEFLKSCTCLREFHLDGVGLGKRILNLDEDLNLFSSSCKLKRVVISNMTIGIRDSTVTPRPSKVTTPRFFFCEFSPFVIQHFSKFFPSLDHIHFRNYPQLSFFENCIDMDSIQFVGIWGAKLMTSGIGGNNACFTTFLNHDELKRHIKQGNIQNKIGKFVSHGFFMRKRRTTDSSSSSRGSSQWEVKETIRNPSGFWEEEFLKQIFDDFQYATFLSFHCFQNLFRYHY